MFGAGSFSAFPFSDEGLTGPLGVTGLAATSGVGSVSVNGDSDISVTGLGATASVGAAIFNENPTVTGLAATGSVGSVVGSAGVTVEVTGRRLSFRRNFVCRRTFCNPG